MNYTFRPLPLWPHPITHNRRSRSTFKAGWDSTMKMLARELEHLGARDVMLAAGFNESEIRMDGMLRSNAREPLHPGVEVSFETAHGRLVYATDVCMFWQHNVRSIALGLGALRAVDRYGITRRGEQYAGWLQLGSTSDLAERGKRLVEVAGGLGQALKLHHPDLGGERADWDAVQAYRKTVTA
jgi:hypothetical protein